MLDSCIALVPTLQVHLLRSVSPRKLVHRLGCHQLDLCMMVVQEIKVTYFGAEILHRLFTRARDVINVRARVLESPTPAGTNESGMVVLEGRERHDRETASPASPMIWAFNAASNYGHETGARYVSSTYDSSMSYMFGRRHLTNQRSVANMKMQMSMPSSASASFPISGQVRR
jgi:hypothetical protein